MINRNAIPFIVLGAGVAFYLAFLKGDEYDWPVNNKHTDPKVIVAFGDSLTTGHSAKQGHDYPTHLGKLWRRNIINMGKDGDTAFSAEQRLDKDVLVQKPDVVLITLGGNDLIRNIPLSETMKSLEQIFTKTVASGAMVVYLNIDPPFVGDNWSLAIQHLCKRHGVLWVNKVMQGLWGDSKLMADRIHPNGEGYKIVAERVFARLGTL